MAMAAASATHSPLAHRAASPKTEADTHCALAVTLQPPQKWYKDQFGRKATFDVRVQRVGHGCAACVEQRHLAVQLLYENGKAVENQAIVRITSGLCLSKGSNESALAIRIMEVSKNHQNQRFRLQISLPQCQLSGVRPTPAVTEPVLVLSKKNKRPAKSDGDEMLETPSKTKRTKAEDSVLTPGARRYLESPPYARESPMGKSTMKTRAGSVDSYSEPLPDASDWASAQAVRFKAPTESVCLWANAAYNFLHELQWQRPPHAARDEQGEDADMDEFLGHASLKPFQCPVCHESYGSTPQHRSDCDLSLLLRQSGSFDAFPKREPGAASPHGSRRPPSRAKKPSPQFIFTDPPTSGGSAFTTPNRPPRAASKYNITQELLQFSETPSDDTRARPAPAVNAVPPSLDGLAKNLNLNSWEGYSALSKVMFSTLDMEGTSAMDADDEQQSQVGTPKAAFPRPSALPSAAAADLLPGVRPPVSSQLQAALPQRSEPPSGFSQVSSSKHETSRVASAILQELDAELNGDANLLCSLSRVSLSDFLNSEAAEAVQRVDPQYFSTLSSLLAEDPKSRSSSEDGVAFIVGADFRHCGYPAFDEAFALLGFYFLSGSAERANRDLRFMPNFYPLPPEMLHELEQSVREWRRDGSLVFARQHDEQHRDAMGKGDFLTPKAIATRMKAKGLQKLRWFCQVCQKQCRDENGFKCHTTSESHQRQMLIVANDPDKFISDYSEMFETAFLENLRRRHGTKRLRATVVYNEYIADKLHVHMNSTQWTTLGSFVQYLGRTGKCTVDETEKYIDRDPRTLARQEELEKKTKADLDHEERNRAFIARQLRIAQEAATERADPDAHRPTKLQRSDKDEKITIGFAPQKASRDAGSSDAAAATPAFNVFGGADATAAMRSQAAAAAADSDAGAGKRKRNAVDAIMAEEERRKRQLQQKQEEARRKQKLEHWVTPGIVVKVVNKKVGGGVYYKRKGVVTAVEDQFCATVELAGSGDVLRLDQDDLETVIPTVGRRVKIVNGVGRGSVAELLAISVDDFCASVRIRTGSRKGDVLERVEYEDICKLADD
ncbi:hypothetical protein PybrP1_005761 [[Pythium] brassicae (nom. inval.)]|nr:hypothetical protein PybrP1_005761 [[Pythium] brassicae (nom. inval.)]